MVTEAADLADWAADIAQIPRRRIEAICHAVLATGALDTTLVDHLVEFLDLRKTRILELLRTQGDAFEAIERWSMT